MSKILFPVDFSEKSQNAVKLAAKIGGEINGEVHLLHFSELPSGTVDMGAGSNFSVPGSMMYLSKVKEKLYTLKKDFFSDQSSVKCAIRLQNPSEGIREYSAKTNADLIILGIQGVSGFDEMIVGSSSSKVVSNSEIPVIQVSSDSKEIKLNDLVFASDFKENHRESFEKFLNFAKIFKSKIHLLKINTTKRFESSHVTEKKIRDFIKGIELPKKTINVYNDTSVVRGIANFSKEINADLIAMTTHGRTGLSGFFNGSIAKRVAKNALSPVITYKL